MFDYKKALADRVVGIKPSGIRKFFDILDEMKDVVSLTVGQPDFVTPWHIREAGIKSLEEGRTYYTSNSGIIEMREEIAKYQSRRFGLEYSPKDEIIVTVGGSEAIDMAIRAVTNEGDEIIIPEPSFVCYSPLISMSGGVPVSIALKKENSFKLTAKELEGAITPRTKALILPFPNNPTGACMRKKDLEHIVKVIKDTNIVVISDEIYGELSYEEPHCSIASLSGMRERTIVISGFSKAYAMTGWRLGYALAPRQFTAEMAKIHQFGIMCAPTTSQYAAVSALKYGDSDIEYMKGEYDARRRYIVKRLKDIGIDCFMPEGAFYVFADISHYGMTSDRFCERLLMEKGVAIVPGTAFGESGEGFVRISYAYSIRQIDKAMALIEKFVKTL